MAKTRCVNLDWLEVYCLESSIGYPHDAEYFRRAGWHVREREYGTPTYKEMFTLFSYDNDEPLIEVRRAPKAPRGYNTGGIMDPKACHIRLCNRTCYMEDAAGLLQRFLEENFFEYSRISRVDIALDFEKFDSGDDPQKFLQRYIKGQYAKINQARISMHGADRWDGRTWNSVKWGNENSMVSTKMYCKTLELLQVSDKPYIRQAWYEAGLIDDWFDMTKRKEDGTVYKPEIWRIEFSIKSSTKNWFVVEDPYSTKRKLKSIRHTLEQYRTRRQMLDVFFSLADHYFHFKKFTEGVRKDRCEDKVLFDKKIPSVFYKVTHVATHEKQDKTLQRLLRMLRDYQSTIYDEEKRQACRMLIADIEYRARAHDLPNDTPIEELTLLRQLVAKRVMGSPNTLSQDINIIKAMLDIETDIFGETREK